MRYRQQVSAFLRQGLLVDAAAAFLQNRRGRSLEARQRHPGHQAHITRRQQILRLQLPEFYHLPPASQFRPLQPACHRVAATDAETAPRIKHHRQKLGKHTQVLIGEAQVVQRLFQDSLLRIGGNLQEKVVGGLAAVEEDFQQAVGQLTRLHQLRLQGSPAPHLPHSAKVQDTSAVFFDQPLAALVVLVMSHVRPLPTPLIHSAEPAPDAARPPAERARC